MQLDEIRKLDIRKVNSLTKYPSIPTYHRIGTEKPMQGKLFEEVQVSFAAGEKLIVTEKIDGTNARIISFPAPGSPYLLGSREDLLHFMGDLIFNPAQGIVEALKAPIDPVTGATLVESFTNHTENVNVFYVEVYGIRGLPESKNYSSTGRGGIRLFDIASYPLALFLEMLKAPIEQIASWRDKITEIPFVSEQQLLERSHLPHQVTPRLHAPDPTRLRAPDPIPTSVPDTYEWLKSVLGSGSQAMLDPNAAGKAEGVVVRTEDRKKIAKIRFEDYERTLHPQGGRK